MAEMLGGVPILVGAAIVALIGVLSGLRRVRIAGGRIDPFHPLLIPTIYVCVATLAPIAWIWVRGDLGFITKASMSPRTPLLLALAVIGFTLGAGLRLGRRKTQRPVQLDPSTLTLIGRVTVAIPLLIAARDLANDMVLIRGVGQNIYTLNDTISAAGLILPPAGVTLIIVGRAMAGVESLGTGNVIIVATLVGLLSVNGHRGAALSIMLILTFYYTRRGATALRALIGLTIATAFAYAVLTYRLAATHSSSTLNVAQSLLRDVGSVAFTTGVIDRVTANQTLGGSTIVAAVLRLLPSPVAIALFGQPTDTGSGQFRTLSGLTYANNGYGFSIPAEGVLNFGIGGAFLLPFVFGATFAWMYSRFDLNGTHPSQWIYLTTVGVLPYAWRSDSLGVMKSIIYPLILFLGAAVLARTALRLARSLSFKPLAAALVSQSPHEPDPGPDPAGVLKHRVVPSDDEPNSIVGQA